MPFTSWNQPFFLRKATYAKIFRIRNKLLLLINDSKLNNVIIYTPIQELDNAVKYFLGPHQSTEVGWIWVGGRRRAKPEVKKVEWEFADCETIEWKIKWETKPKSKEMEKDVLTMSRWGTIEAESKDGPPRPFACQCPDP